MNTIRCTHCGKDIEISEALSHELKAKYESDYQEKLKEAQYEAEEKAVKKVAAEMELKMKDKENEAVEAKERALKLQEEILKMNSLIRELKDKDDQRELEMKKRLMQEEEKIREEASKKAQEENLTVLQQKDKQIADAMKEVEDMKRKLQQGSQQAQGEVFELEFEKLLKERYHNDKIEPVGKGVRGGDIIQEVWDRNGNFVGKILWELKNTKTWQEPWIDKLKADQRAINAEEAVLISEILPSDMQIAGFRKSVWVTGRQFAFPLADTLRAKLIQLYIARNSVKAKDEKMEILYTYLSGTEFKHRVEAIVEAFSSMQNEIEKEKRYFSLKWARDEKNIRYVIDNTIGMHGDLKGIIGSSLPQIKSLEIFELAELEDGK